MDLGLAGKSVLVTGTSRGIGLAVAEWFLKEGCDLFMVSRTAKDLEASADKLAGAYPDARVEWLAVDLGDDDAADRIHAWRPDVDILINNAGDIPSGTIDEVGPAAWREAWVVKVFGYTDLSRLYMAGMASRASGGVIVNVIGAAGEMLDAGYIAGSVGNAALIAFTKTLGSNSIDKGVRVVGVNPGPVDTDRMARILKKKALEKLGDESRWQELASAFPLGRSATVDEIAATIIFLASPLSGYTSGTVINVDGGITNKR